MNVESLLQQAWGYIKKEMPDVDVNSVMEQATEIGKSHTTTNGVMSWLEEYARSKGWGPAFQNNVMWNSFRDKKPDEVLSHAWKTIQQMGAAKIFGSMFGK
jgi:hypothetical protein